MTDQHSPLPVGGAVTISDLRRRPAQCFEHGTASVTHRGDTVGYLMSPEDFEHGLKLLAQVEDPQVLKDKLGLTDTWLNSVGKRDNP